ncbi:hypothetical protein KQI49_17360 [Virgibacillus sp. MSJ-26]|uniref:tetratricopeptide repeat protein n=1 Tax=Virgibacillus sp. MSJ-26 TaxID=2841522 RepID=UPI001C1212C9|nr:hypothetical protein [Virgibacillus sp. MSJ-26]MBU5468581.1 hypothetical protein [Virgibacillus sp. MSJ-26]
MTTENELINKTYYRGILDENKQGHAVKILGEMYMEMLQEPRPRLSSVRFAQGEVYFLNNDYEAAIFKWQQPMDKEFIPWAEKNIADAHLEMGLLDEAEKFYKQVDTSSLALQSEVLLQLFSLYIQQGHQEKAVRTIRNAVSLNPDYSQVTEVAKSYLEGVNEWDFAVELAVSEALRLKSPYWFEVLSGYVERGSTRHYEPIFFKELLATLLQMDDERFENFTEVLWNNYRDSDMYLAWLEMMNQLVLEEVDESSYDWKILPSLYQEGYFDLISGRFLIKDISAMMPDLVKNWLDVSYQTDDLVSSTAALAWDEMFPNTLDQMMINEAASRFERSDVNENGRKEGLELFDSIKAWAEREGLAEDLAKATEPMLEGYNMEVASPSKIRELVKVSIEFLLEQKAELENVVQEDIDWSEGLQTNLKDVHDQLGEMESDMTDDIAASFRHIKNSVTQQLKSELPKLLQNCSQFIEEDSNFSTLHVDLNEEMNRRMAVYMKNFVNDNLKSTIQDWIGDCKREFDMSQRTFNELSATLNQQFNEEKIVLQGDFKVLDDWRRDLERMARSLLRFEKINFVLRNTPSQLLLKGAGKLVESISRSKEKVHSKYKSYIENADFTQVVEDLIAPFIQQLELFEGSIEWDVDRFFSNPLDVLNGEMEEAQLAIEKHQAALNRMQEEPEIYRDPLTLFELKLRQYELMNRID